MQLASRFKNPLGFRSDYPLSDEQIRNAAPSIFAAEAHESRSERYTYIPTGEVLGALRRQGFEPFMVCQTRVRDNAKRMHTKHMIRLRHASQITKKEANEIVMLNSHDGTSSYQMMAGMFRFVCANGMVCGEIQNDIRVRHNGNVVGEVIEGAFKVLNSFETITEQREGMQSLRVNQGEQLAFARAALALKYDSEEAAPVAESQILMPRRRDDAADDLWTTFNRVQENMLRGGLTARATNGRRSTTRAVSGIDQNIKLNRALWLLADEMRKLKA